MKIIKLVMSLLLLTSSHIFAQENDGVSVSKNQKKPSFVSFDNEAENKFERDLKLNSLKIYLLGGIQSVITKEDVGFEKEYTIQYYDFGCTPPSNFKVFEQYNHLVFNHLLKEQGKTWISFVNKNAFGYAKWCEINAKN